MVHVEQECCSKAKRHPNPEKLSGACFLITAVLETRLLCKPVTASFAF
jgi:hypothetical protein